MDLEYATYSVIGDRESNQDFSNQLITQDWALFVVADGLGGHADSEWASIYFCEALITLAKNSINDFLLRPKEQLEQIVFAAAEEMSNQLIATDHRDAGTVCAIAWMSASMLITAHVGDSRIYLLNRDKIRWRSKDHSLIEELVTSHQITEAEMSNHPQQNVLLRSLAVAEVPEFEINMHQPLQTEELLLLCTDGFWQFVYPEEMQQLCESKQLEKDLNTLVETAVSRGHPYADNTTVQAVRLWNL